MGTFLGVFVAYKVYKNQKRDFKRDAAGIVLAEIRHAEATIDKLKENINTLDFVTVLPREDNWSKYNYLFINDLDGDQLTLINNFYAQSAVIDKAIVHLSISSQLNQKSFAIQTGIAEIARTSKNKTEFESRKTDFISLLNSEGFVFTPKVAKDTLLKSLDNIHLVTTSTAGDILKKIAQEK